MNIKPAKEFRDPIHGFIPVYDHELQIIQDPVFQRLRRVKQLSFGYFVYHGAEHSRFGHVIGVMHLVERALNKIIENGKKFGSSIDISEEDIQLARVSALLHDVGHHPFSHALDDSNIIPDKHEKYSTTLVENHFASILDKATIKPKDVVQLILGKFNPEKPYLSELIHSQIDMDRCDYLLRDSHYAGVKYGIYDLDRLIDSLFVSDDGQLVILNKGFFSAEQFILARYHMFSQIYLHKTKRCIENLTKKACLHLIEKNKFNYPNLDDIKSKDGIKKFSELDDAWLLKEIKTIDDSKMEGIVHSIINREPYSVVLDSEILGLKIAKTGIGKDGSIFVKSVEDDLKYELEKTDHFNEKGITAQEILFDEAKNLSYKLRPYATIIPEEQENPHTIQIYDDKSQTKTPIEEKSNIIKILGEPIKLRRIYVQRTKKEILLNYLEDKYPTLK